MHEQSESAFYCSTELVLRKDSDHLLGKGYFCTVYQGLYGTSPVAVKVDDGKLADIFANEAAILAKVKHPHIVKFIGLHEKGIVLELAPRGDLAQAIDDKILDSKWERIRQCAPVDIASGLSYLHTNGIIHRDIKSSNIIIDIYYRTKIADFGLAKQVGESDNCCDSPGTVSYVAPEILQVSILKRPYSGRAADVYAFGLVYWEVVARMHIQDGWGFTSNNVKELLAYRLANIRRLPKLAVQDNPLAEKIISQILAFDFTQRPTMDAIVRQLQEAAKKLPNSALPPLFEAISDRDLLGVEAFASPETVNERLKRPGNALHDITPVYMASCLAEKHHQILSVLLHQKGVANMYAPDGSTPLIAAVMRGGLAQVKLILKSGHLTIRDVNAKTERGESALFIAASQGGLQKVKLLMRCREIDLHARRTPGDGITAWEEARSKQYNDIASRLGVELIRKYGENHLIIIRFQAVIRQIYNESIRANHKIDLEVLKDVNDLLQGLIEEQRNDKVQIVLGLLYKKLKEIMQTKKISIPFFRSPNLAVELLKKLENKFWQVLEEGVINMDSFKDISSLMDQYDAYAAYQRGFVVK